MFRNTVFRFPVGILSTPDTGVSHNRPLKILKSHYGSDYEKYGDAYVWLIDDTVVVCNDYLESIYYYSKEYIEYEQPEIIELFD